MVFSYVAEKSDWWETRHHSESWRTQVYYASGPKRASALKIWAPSSGAIFIYIHAVTVGMGSLVDLSSYGCRLQELPWVTCVCESSYGLRAVTEHEIFGQELRQNKQRGGWVFSGSQGHPALRPMRQACLQKQNEADYEVSHLSGKFLFNPPSFWCPLNSYRASNSWFSWPRGWYKCGLDVSVCLLAASLTIPDWLA